MTIRESSYGYWSSTAAFVWVAAGASIGIGNVARLPYLMGQYGGVVFLVVYLLALVFVSLPMLATEWLIGRFSRADAVDAFANVSREAGARRLWVLLGWFSLAGAVLVLSYYGVVVGWSAAYIFRAAGGALMGSDAAHVRSVFYGLAQDPERSLSWHTIFMVMACIIVAHGVREGLERAARVWVPISLLMAVTVLAYAMFYGNASEALNYLLAPDLFKLGWRGIAEALQLAFFTVGLGMGVMLTLGSYLPAGAPLARAALLVIALDVAFSLVAGVALFAIIFSAGLDPAPGVLLNFLLLPQALPASGMAVLIGVLIYCMMFVITMASATALLEPITRYLMERWRAPRVFAATSGALLIWFIGLCSLLSFSVLAEFRVLGRNFFEWVQFLTGSLLAPAVGLLTCVFVARILPGDFQRRLWGERHLVSYDLWAWSMRFPARIGLIIVLLYAAGVLGWFANLWSG
jgi:neurotransmitter:Na+ symporter, NSS family